MFPFFWVPELSRASAIVTAPTRLNFLNGTRQPYSLSATELVKAKVTYWRFTANQLVLASSLMRLTTRDFLSCILEVIVIM
jgi:hypothetical protein